MPLDTDLLYEGGVYRIILDDGTLSYTFYYTIGGVSIHVANRSHRVMTDQSTAGAISTTTGRHRIKRLGERVFIRFALPEFGKDAMRVGFDAATAATQWAGGRYYFPLDHVHHEPMLCNIEPAIPAPTNRIYKFAFHHCVLVPDSELRFAKGEQLGIPVVLEALWSSTLNRFGLVYYDTV